MNSKTNLRHTSLLKIPNPIFNFSSFISLKEFFILSLFVIINSFLLYNTGKDVLGPTFGADELLYFSLGKSISSNFSYQNHAQYNPLYSFLISFFFKQGDLIKTFVMIKTFNVIIFSSMVFPLFLICKRLIDSIVLCYVTSFAITLFPWKVVTNLIVAESLYFTLLVWSIFLYIAYITCKSTKRAICYGISLGLLFLCKQAGIVLIIATAFALTFEFYFIENKSKEHLKIHFTIFLTAILLIIPWLIRNAVNTTSGGIGYASEFANVQEHIGIWALIRGSISQFSYISLGCYVFFFVIFLNVLFRFKDIPLKLRSFIVLISFFILGIVGISALHHIAQPTYPYGRYVTTTFPFIIIIAISNMNNDKISTTKRLPLILIAACLLCVDLYSNIIPLTLHVKGYFNSFDTAIWSKLFLADANLYSVDAVLSALKSDNINTYIVPVSMFILCIIAILLLKTRLKYLCPFLFFLIAIWGSINNNNKEVHVMKANGNPPNELYRYMLQHDISPQEVFKLDQNLGNPDYERTWFNTFYADTDNLIKTLPLDKLISQVNFLFDFGGTDTPILDNAQVIQAPWVTESSFEGNNIYGFDIFDTYVDTNCTIGSVSFENTAPSLGLNDIIYGTSENKFYIDIKPGEYNLTINTNNSPLPFTPQLGCSIYLNNIYIGRLDSNISSIHLKNFKNTEELLTLKFVPDEGCVWTIGTLEISPISSLDLEGKYILSSSTTDFSRISKLLSLELIFSNSSYYLYRLNEFQ